MRKSIIFVLVFAVLATFVPIALSQVNQNETLNDLYAQVELFSYALTTIQSEYVEEKTPKDLIYGSLRGMLDSLDPHSQFLDPDEYRELKTETQGKFGGLGIEISIKDDLLTVITPIDDTPAWKAGLKPGDRIVKIEDELTRDMSLSDAVKLLRGDPGTDVTITVLREEGFKLLDFTITREIIRIQDVKNPMILTDNIAYIRLAEFRENSHTEFHKALVNLMEEGADSLVLDLRSNPGGLLNVAIRITEEFLPEGELIVTTKGRLESQTIETISEKTPDKFLDMPIAVLINGGSASGSEILAGALKDNHHAVLVGTKSFGKGSVQSVIPLPDGSGLRLTTSKYFTPSGRSIHGEGIEPDIVVKLDPEDEEDAEAEKEKKAKERSLDEVFENVKSDDDAKDDATKKLSDKEKETLEKLLKDNQVQTAIQVIKGIKVYRSYGEDVSLDVVAEAEAIAADAAKKTMAEPKTEK